MNISKCGGFTLVEVLAAVLILSIGLLAAVSSIQACRTVQDRTYYIPLARNVAQGMIEDARSRSFTSLDSMAGVFGNEYMPEGSEVIVEVTPYPDAYEPHMRKVTVTVTWPEGSRTGRIRYETLVVRR